MMRPGSTGYSPRTIRRWVAEGEIPAYRPGRKVGTSIRLDEEEVLAYLRRIPTA